MGGAQRYVASLAEGLRGYGYDIEVAFGLGEELGEWCRAHGVPVHRAALDNPIRPHQDFLAYLQLLRLMRRGRYDIVHPNSTKAGIIGLAAARAARVPVRVFTAHGLRSVLLPSSRQRAFWTWMEARYTRSADSVIEVCEYGLRVGREKGVLSPDRSTVIHNGISLARVESGRQAGRRRQDVGLEDEDLVIGTVGRLDEAKGMEWWLRAAALIARQEPRARFLVVGDGPERGQLVKLSEELGVADRVRWAGIRPGIEYLPLFDVFLQSSLWEGLSMAILEAMAAGLPTVATDVGGNPEVIINGKTGWLVPPRDEQALAAKVLQVLSDPARRRAMGEAARQYLQREFTEEQMVARVAALYQRLLQAKGLARPS